MVNRFKKSIGFVGEEFVTSIRHSDEYYVNLLFDCTIYRPMCTHMGWNISWVTIRHLV